MAGHQTARCVAYGDAGGYCGLGCSTDADCAGGRVCRAVSSVLGGAQTQQCVVPGAEGDALGACTCSPQAIALGLQTTCWITTGSGPTALRCKGTRACSKDGLGACVALTGDAAECAQLQCLDPNTLAPVADGAACDDGRACTQDDVCKVGTCVSGQQICPCEPGFKACEAAAGGDATNLCLGEPVCAPALAGAETPFACKPNPATAKICDASLDDACSKNACVPLSGACTLTAVERTELICDLPTGTDGTGPACRRQVLPDAAPSAPAAACDDGLPCSPGDACADGLCKPTSLLSCGCQNDVDCVDDGDLCNGLPYCDKTGVDGAGFPVWQCKVNPATVVACDTSQDGNCQQTSCEPSSGSCKVDKKPAFAPCDDGVACTVGDVCSASGACKPGTWTCCKSDLDCAAKEDGDFCNGTLFCNLQTGGCENNPATMVVCPTIDNSACLVSSCQKSTGQCALMPTNLGKPCDDGNPCSDLDLCDAAGACKPGKDICPCKTDADCAAHDDGDLCNGTFYCNPVAGPGGTGTCRPNPKTIVSCPSVDDTACRRNQCEPKTGFCTMVDLPAQTTCDADGTACTTGDVCDGKGQCVAGPSVCACLSDGDCVSKEDGDLCNGTLYCDKTGATAVCKLNPATVKTCPSAGDSACQKNICQPQTGACVVQALPAGSPCNDGEPCTQQDGCDGKGQCAAGAVAGCGCKGDADCLGFDDGDVCNGSYACSGGACVFTGKALLCDDADPCTLDSCDAVQGCQHAKQPKCASCKQGADCDDGNICTSELCMSGQCLVVAAGGLCDDGEVCTSGDACSGGACKAGAPTDCGDGDLCTDDSCTLGKGCAHAANTAPCSDGDPCTTGDVCAKGVCLPGEPSSCDDSNACTVDSCASNTGCKHTAVADETNCTADETSWCLNGKCVVKPSCGPGLEVVQLDVAGAKQFTCAAAVPTWGLRPDKPVGVYTVQDLQGQKVVLDSQTKLMWQQAQSSNKLNHWDAINYCDKLVYAGHHDWRLPTLRELSTLLDFSYGGLDPSIDPIAFPGVPKKVSTASNATYWTSTKVVGYSGPWTVDFTYGITGGSMSSNPWDVRCVRGSPPAGPQARYEKAAAGTFVTDGWTKLKWMLLPASASDYAKAVSFCATKTDDGGGWRVPTLRELYSIVDVRVQFVAHDKILWFGYTSTNQGHFMTSTLKNGTSKPGWKIYMNTGGISLGTDGGKLRCVKGG